MTLFTNSSIRFDDETYHKIDLISAWCRRYGWEFDHGFDPCSQQYAAVVDDECGCQIRFERDPIAREHVIAELWSELERRESATRTLLVIA